MVIGKCSIKRKTSTVRGQPFESVAESKEKCQTEHSSLYGVTISRSKFRFYKVKRRICAINKNFFIESSNFRNPFSTKNQLDLIRNDIPKLSPHQGRSLLWATEDKEENKTSNFSPLFMCPATINQTETARLVLELER